MNTLAPLLSKREREVMVGLSGGQTVSEIAQVMRIAPRTVSEYRQRVREKLGCATCDEAMWKWGTGELRTKPGAVQALLREAVALVG